MRARQCMVIAMATLAAVLLPGLVHGDDWPRWRGPSGDGISRETDWDPQAIADGAEILWTADVGMGHSSLVIAKGRLYTMGDRPVGLGLQSGEHEDVVSCLDARTGVEIWQYSYPCKEGDDPGPGSTPTLEADALYTIGRNGELLCLGAGDGRVRWRRNLLTEQLSAATRWGFAGSVLVEGDLLLLNGGAAGIAFDKRTGRMVWSSALEECGASTPVVFDHNGGRLAAIAAREAVRIVDATSGERRWSYKKWVLNDPLIFDSKMLISGDGPAELLAIGGEELTRIWQASILRHFQTPVRIGEHLYGIDRTTGNSFLQCVVAETGELRWSHDIGPWGAFTAADGKLLLIDDQGRLVIAEASPAGFHEIASAKVLEMADNTGIRQRRQCHCWTSPALANGLLYVRNTYGNLTCVDLRPGASSPGGADPQSDEAADSSQGSRGHSFSLVRPPPAACCL